MKKKQSCIVTITDGISPTSMPFNEFILYRLHNFAEEKQILIQVFEHGVNGDVKIPEGLDYYSFGMNPCAIRKKVRELEEKYDVVSYHIHEGKSVILFSLVTFGKYRNKTIYTLHSTFRNYPFHNKLFSFCASLLAKDVVCVSKTSLKYLPRILRKLRRQHALVIQNGVDVERIDSVAYDESKPEEPFTMIYVARLVELKRHYILLEALKRLPNVRLQLIGVGPLEKKLKRRVKETNIDNQVFFYGLKSREEVYKMLKEADLYVSSSSYEGLPIGVLEAMGCGIPCLVSDIEQHAEIAERCPSLQLCSDEIEQWINNIKIQQNMSKKETKTIGETNRQLVIKEFSLSSMHEKYNSLYYKR